MLAGQLIDGFSLSLTVTVKLQPLVLPLASVTVKQMVVVPFGKAEPLDNPPVCITLSHGQLSVAVAVYVTTAEHFPGSVFVVMLPGQVMTGLVMSVTVMVWTQLELALPQASVAVNRRAML